MYQLPWEFGSFNGLAGLCISVYYVCLSVLWRFSRLLAMGVSIVWVAYMYIFLDQSLLIMYTWHLNQQFPRILTLHLHNKMRLNVNLHFVTLFMLLIHCVAR